MTRRAVTLHKNFAAWIMLSSVPITFNCIFTCSFPQKCSAETNLQLQDRARQALDTTNYDEAASLFTKCLDRFPDQRSYFLRQRGTAYLGLLRFDLAIEDFKAAGPPQSPIDEAELSAVPSDDDGTAPDWLKALVLYTAGRRVYREGNLQQCLALFEAALALRPNFPECLANKAAVLSAFGQRMAAEDLSIVAVSLRPQSYDCWYDLASIWARNGKLSSALAAIDCSINAMKDGSIPQIEKHPQYQLMLTMKSQINDKLAARSQQQQPYQVPPPQYPQQNFYPQSRYSTQQDPEQQNSQQQNWQQQYPQRQFDQQQPPQQQDSQQQYQEPPQYPRSKPFQQERQF